MDSDLLLRSWALPYANFIARRFALIHEEQR